MRGAWRYPRLRKYRHLETEARWNRKGLHSAYVFQRLCRRESFKSSDLHGWPLHGIPSCQDRRPRWRRLWHFALSLQAIGRTPVSRLHSTNLVKASRQQLVSVWPPIRKPYTIRLATGRQIPDFAVKLQRLM